MQVLPVQTLHLGKDTHYARAFDCRGIELSKLLRFSNTNQGYKALEDWIAYSGLFGQYFREYPDNKTGYIRNTQYYLLTHALLQDSEGNNIVIDKTDTDVVFITATFYCTYTPSGFGSNGIYPEANKNYLLKWVLRGSFDNSVRFSRFTLPYSSLMLDRYDGESKYTGFKSWEIRNAVGVAATGKLDMPMMTFLDSECNNRIIKHFGNPGVGAITFPNHDFFPPYLVERIPIGTGDGATTAFNIKAPVIMPGSETIYVNNVVKTRDVDYTIDYESNCGDWYENYHTAGLSCRSNGVSFGDLASRTPNKNYSYRDPLAWWYCYDSTFYPSSCTVNETNPIKIDFGTAKACNTLKIEILTVPTAQVDNLKIQTSSDGTNWTDVPNMTRSNQVWKFTETSARYWRVFIPNYNWLYSLYHSNLPTRDGQYYGSSFFLGKTVPGLKFLTPPAAGAAIDATYSLEYPFKTSNNLLRFTYSIVLQRG